MKERNKRRTEKKNGESASALKCQDEMKEREKCKAHFVGCVEIVAERQENSAAARRSETRIPMEKRQRSPEDCSEME